MRTVCGAKLHLLLPLICAFSLAGCSSSSSTSEAAGAYGYDGYDVLKAADDIYPYRQNSPYASVLENCTEASTVSGSCRLSTLPFVGNGTDIPTTEDVMNRVLVTHNWMGARFEALLNDAPPDLLNLFSSTTAVIIGSDVRPSRYQSLTGAISLDSNYLWTTLDEKLSVSKQDDPRSDYGADLQFWFIGSFRNTDGSRLYPSANLDDDNERSVEDTRLSLYRLLYHELAHATDFMPRDKIAGLDPNQTVYDAISSVRNDWLAVKLYAEQPLSNVDLQGFAKVRFRGETADDVQSQSSPSDLGALMRTDGAVQFYSYTSIHEDLAQLATAVMMAYHFGGQTNIAFTAKPEDENDWECSDLTVGWGQRNRVADPMVTSRALLAADLVVSINPDVEAKINNSGLVEDMDTTKSWCDNQEPAVPVPTDNLLRSAPVDATTGPTFQDALRQEQIEFSHGPVQD